MAVKKTTKAAAPKKKAASAKKSAAKKGTAPKKTSAAKKSAPKKAAPKKAAPKKAAPKLTAPQLDLLKRVGGAGAAGYLGKKAEGKSLEVLRGRKLVKRGAKDKASGSYHFMVSNAGKKHLDAQSAAPAASAPAAPATPPPPSSTP
jgi:hypothetical protein